MPLVLRTAWKLTGIKDCVASRFSRTHYLSFVYYWYCATFTAGRRVLATDISVRYYCSSTPNFNQGHVLKQTHGFPTDRFLLCYICESMLAQILKANGLSQVSTMAQPWTGRSLAMTSVAGGVQGEESCV